MGGLGSGYSQWAFRRSVVEHYQALDINKIRRKYKLKRGASLNLKGSDEWIELEWTPCNFGGERPWFVCPGLYCRRTVGKLYICGNKLRCRHCLDLAYATQRQDPISRLATKAHKIRTKLGATQGWILDIPTRPKGMRAKTYQALSNELMNTVHKITGIFGKRFSP